MTEDQLLDLLRQNQSGFISGGEMSHKLGISRTAIWKHIEHLRKLGYEIEAQPHQGYRLVSIPDRLIPEEIRFGLNTRWMGQKIVSYEETASTNDVAAKLAVQGMPEGTVVFAESQSKGRGRLGRAWVSPKGKSILMSVIFRPKLLPNQASQITLMSAVAAAKAVEKETGITSQIKWPNDILIEGKKIAGILTEMQAETDQIRYLIVGIGMNVNVPKEALPENATSIHIETGDMGQGTGDRIRLAQELLRQLERGYDLLHDGQWETVCQEWQERSILTGKQVNVRCMERQIEGTVTGLDPDGSLLIRLDHGLTERVMAGDVVAVR
ncbi:MAG: biotin--[acetyl-CoA-carboxylase] ligase [Candidatus Omnitrophica bacterium]|nr:biotin--[acetyl-CoA-carboxylase] ligase [Candidatus Omnitrophota bacterium]